MNWLKEHDIYALNLLSIPLQIFGAVKFIAIMFSIHMSDIYNILCPVNVLFVQYWFLPQFWNVTLFFWIILGVLHLFQDFEFFVCDVYSTHTAPHMLKLNMPSQKYFQMSPLPFHQGKHNRNGDLSLGWSA